jgi:fatty acid amide hydrolase
MLTLGVDYDRLYKDRVIVGSIVGLVSLFSISALVKFIKRRIAISEVEETRKKAKSARDLKIDRFVVEHRHKVPADTQTRILEADVTLLTSMIKNKKVTCEEVFLTYAMRAATIGRELNLIADCDFEEGYRLSLEADYAIREGKELGPLHGIPVSVYEQISIKGLLTTCGFASLVRNINLHDSYVVSVLRKLGAIPYLKSNVPQGFMALETSNGLWGRAKNPWNPLKSTGGSNGGEAGLVAARCSPLGIGNDLFGSIRIPASFCGVYGFKPTSNRISQLGRILYNGRAFNGFYSISPSHGTLCRSIDDLVLVSRSLFGKFEDDYLTPLNNMPFNEKIFTKVIDNNNHPQKIGYFAEIKDFPTAPGVRDALNETIHYLRTAGYHLIEFPISNFDEFIYHGMIILNNSDALKMIKRQLKNEELEMYHENAAYLTSSSNLCLSIMAGFRSMIGNQREAKIIRSYDHLTKSEFVECNIRFLELKAQFIDYWREHKFDALLSPVFPLTASDYGVTQHLLPFNHMSFIHNIADLPSVVIPVKLNKNLVYTDIYKDMYSDIARKSMVTSESLPVAVQIATLPGHDEWALRLAKEIDYFFKFDETINREILKRYPVLQDIIIKEEIKKISVKETTVKGKTSKDDIKAEQVKIDIEVQRAR